MMGDEVGIQKRGIGVNLERTEAYIRLWSPNATAIAIHLIDQQITIALQKEEYGYWTLQTDKIKAGDRYKFIIDAKDEWPDPASLSQPEGVHGPSQVLDLSFKWTDDSWRNILLKEYIIYELHTGTFSEEGTFAGIERHLDHLKDLGITAIEIMPVAQFPGERNWGYDGVFPFAVQHSYGGAKSLQQLVNVCHEKGFSVILDVVYNHLGPEGNYLGIFGPYFTTKYQTPWGNAINFDDAWCDGVRRYFIENVLMWFRDFHIDALRLDAVHAIKDFSPRHILREIREKVDQMQMETGRQHYLIVESDLNDTRYINPISQMGYGMDAQWVDEFHHALRRVSGEKPVGYYSDFTGIAQLAKAYREAYVYTGEYSLYRKRQFGMSTTGKEGKQFIVFSQNHDQVGNRMLGERTSALLSFGMQKLLAAAVFVSPFLPMLFMGEEWAEINPFLYFVSHTDPELAQAVRKGRIEEFAAFHAEGIAPDPLAESTYRHSKLQWHLRQQEPHLTMLKFYKALIKLKKNTHALFSDKKEELETMAFEDQHVLLIYRHSEQEQLICLLNFSNQAQSVNIPKNIGRWKKLFDSEDPKWGGINPAVHEVKPGAFICSPESVVIYKNT